MTRLFSRGVVLLGVSYGALIHGWILTPPTKPLRTPTWSSPTLRPRVSCCLDATLSEDDTQSIETSTNTNASENPILLGDSSGEFDLATALFLGGLAFDAYVEPAANSSRWERGSQGWQVAFLSTAFARQVYKGLLEMTPRRITGLPSSEDNLAERVLTGDGVDACLLVAVLEGTWKEDLKLLEKEQYHEGVLDLVGAAHVARSTTAWANVREPDALVAKKRTGRMPPYHVPSSWGKQASAVWPEGDGNTQPFYLYVQEPAQARLVLTVVDDDRVVAGGVPIGSTYKKLTDLIPEAALSQDQLVVQLKQQVLQKLQQTGNDMDQLDELTQMQLGAHTWQGPLKLTSKPRKKGKQGQILSAAAAGAMVAGPMGAAAGAMLGSLYEGQVQGTVDLKIRYVPIPKVPVPRTPYRVYGGTPGVDWGHLYQTFQQERGKSQAKTAAALSCDDLEHCFFVNHKKTGATCAVYRSVERKFIVVSFRGTCAPVDLLTDASLVQEGWMQGEEDLDNPATPKVHAGFRGSLNSIARRLKELLLAMPGPGERLEDYDLLVTGHSLGGALSTLFAADLGQYGVDAGRALPQLEASDPWWKSIASTFMGREAAEKAGAEPPRPKSLRLYNFGSPRVGNEAFAKLFDDLTTGPNPRIHEAFRIVNGADVVARMPRTMNALVLGNVGYEHVGKTVLISQPSNQNVTTPLVWIEGQSDDSQCPVRDGVALTSPMADGSLLQELVQTTSETWNSTSVEGIEKGFSWSKVTETASKIGKRFSNMTAADMATVLGLDRRYTQREMELVQSILQGKALAHHLEDEYYGGMGRACGYVAKVGEDIRDLEQGELKQEA